MRKSLIFLIVLLFAGAVPAKAQDETVTPEILASTTKQEVVEKVKVYDKKFWAVAIALPLAMSADQESTFAALKRCASCYETNPLARPFVERGKPVAYTAGLLLDAGVLHIAAKMRGSRHERIRKTWWVMPVALTAAHVLCWRSNSMIPAQ